jgi:uncharacterized protein with von Willebrand factor type A (vWA) domain
LDADVASSAVVPDQSAVKVWPQIAQIYADDEVDADVSSVGRVLRRLRVWNIWFLDPLKTK